MKSSDCVIKHPNQHATGMNMVGAVCDICEAWVCHGRKCLQVHTCECPLLDAVCIECERDVWSHGGRIYRCSFCDQFLCEDDQFEHQASCQQLDAEDYKCISCNRLGQYTCMQCKICFCDDHVKRKGFTYKKNEPYPCPKCQFTLRETKAMSVSAKKHEYGRQNAYEQQENNYSSEYMSYSEEYVRANQQFGDFNINDDE